MRATRASLARADTLLLRELGEGPAAPVPAQELSSQRRLSPSGMVGSRRTWR
jgi:hypothetical protein